MAKSSASDATPAEPDARATNPWGRQDGGMRRSDTFVLKTPSLDSTTTTLAMAINSTLIRSSVDEPAPFHHWVTTACSPETRATITTFSDTMKGLLGDKQGGYVLALRSLPSLDLLTAFLDGNPPVKGYIAANLSTLDGPNVEWEKYERERINRIPSLIDAINTPLIPATHVTGAEAVPGTGMGRPPAHYRTYAEAVPGTGMGRSPSSADEATAGAGDDFGRSPSRQSIGTASIFK